MRERTCRWRERLLIDAAQVRTDKQTGCDRLSVLIGVHV